MPVCLLVRPSVCTSVCLSVSLPLSVLFSLTPRIETECSLLLLLLLLLQRSTAVQVRSSVQLVPQNQPSGRSLLPSPTAWSSDQHPAAMLAYVSWHILGRTEGRGLGFGQLDRTQKGKCLKCQSSSDGHSDHNALCVGGRQWSAGPASASILGQGVPDIHRCISFSLHCTESGEVSWPLCR